MLWEYLDPSPLPPEQRWHKLRALRRAYDVATAAVLAMFLARAVVQLSLFKDNRTGLLAVAKLVMGLPLYLAVVAVVFWVVRRARHRLGCAADAADARPCCPDSREPAGQPDERRTTRPATTASGGADGSPDGGLSLRKGDE